MKLSFIVLQLVTFKLQLLNSFFYSNSAYTARKRSLKFNRSLVTIEATSITNSNDNKHHHSKFQLDITKLAKAVQNVLPKSFQTVVSIIIWYCVASLSNVSNKKMIELMHGFPLIACTIQMSMCSLLVSIYWTISPNSNPYRNQTTLSSVHRKHSPIHTNETTRNMHFETAKRYVRNGFDQFTSPLSTTSAFYGLSQLSTLYALNYGSLSFTQLIKASEPFFHSVFGKVLYNSSISSLSYVSLLPILVGVSLLVRSASRSSHEFTFPWMSLVCGVLSNLFAVVREINIKKYDLLVAPPPSTNVTISKGPNKLQQVQHNISIHNSNSIISSSSSSRNSPSVSSIQYGTLPPQEQSTLYSIFMLQSLRVLLPLAVMVEGPRFYAALRTLPLWKLLGGSSSSMMNSKVLYNVMSAIFTIPSYQILCGLLVASISGILFCANTHLAMSVLKEASPVTRAFANFMKRVVILFVSVLFFRRMTDDSWDWTDVTSIFAILAEGDIDLDFDFLDLDFD